MPGILSKGVEEGQLCTYKEKEKEAMRKELDQQLVSDFPLLFSDRHGDMRSTCMVWGFCCGDGWYKLIYELASKLEPLIVQYRKDNPGDYWPRAAQVKEKFGTLRFYMTSETEEMSKLIKKAEADSRGLCERCGDPGKLREEYGWLVILCTKCDKGT
jgi:hypothetical protein